MSRIICFFIGHRIIKGDFQREHYYFPQKCKRCSRLFGLPTLMESYIKIHYPMPEKEPAFDDLPEAIKDYLFKAHSHDKKGNIIYEEKDIVKLIFKLLKPVGILRTK